MVAQQFGRHSVSATIEGGKSIGGTNLINAFNFTLGGFQHLSAYAADQLNGNEPAYAQVTYMNQLMTFNASPIKALSVGASAEVGNVWSSGQQIGGGALKQSYTFFTSLSTAFACTSASRSRPAAAATSTCSSAVPTERARMPLRRPPRLPRAARPGQNSAAIATARACARSILSLARALHVCSTVRLLTSLTPMNLNQNSM